MEQSHYMRIVEPDVNAPSPDGSTGLTPDLKVDQYVHSVKEVVPAISTKWLLIGAIGFLALKGTKYTLIAGAGFAAGYYVRGKINQANLPKTATQQTN